MPPTYTESQNCLGWKGPLEIILSRPLTREGHLEQEAQEHVQVSFECLWRGTLLDLSGQPVAVLGFPQHREGSSFMLR